MVRYEYFYRGLHMMSIIAFISKTAIAFIIGYRMARNVDKTHKAIVKNKVFSVYHPYDNLMALTILMWCAFIFAKQNVLFILLCVGLEVLLFILSISIAFCLYIYETKIHPNSK